MEAFLVSAGIVALAEIGDKTQLLAFVLAARYRRPLPIILGILVATLVNHALAGAVGRWLMLAVGPTLMRWALAVSFLGTAVAFSAETGEAMVQGAAYGQEQRFPLRVPAPVLLPMLLAWLVWAAAVVGGVLLLRHRSWAAGAAVVAVAAGLSWLLARRFHRLSRRWLVVVPAGVVLHDHLVLGETLMVQRQNVSAVGLALADTQAADLTGPAAGNAVEITVRETVLAVFPSSKEHPTGRAIHMQSFLVSPTRPGRAIHAITGR